MAHYIFAEILSHNIREAPIKIVESSLKFKENCIVTE